MGKKARGRPFSGIKRTPPSPKIKKPTQQINLAVWGATPFCITGFGTVMWELLYNLFHSNPGVYNVYQTGINFRGDFCDEFALTGGPSNGRFRQWPAQVSLPNGKVNAFGQTKFLELLKQVNVDLDAVFLFEDPFWVGGNLPGVDQKVSFVDLIKGTLKARGMAHVPIVGYFPIDGIPKLEWVQNINKLDFPITYLNFGAKACIDLVPEIQGKLKVINHGINLDNFFPISDAEKRTFRRSFFGDRFADQFMVLNVNRNQIRKLIPSNLQAFARFKQEVHKSFMYLNMKPVDLGWDLPECCKSLGLEVGKDVVFFKDFTSKQGLNVSDLNKVFNSADLYTSTACGGGWELSVTQAYATKTPVLIPENTSHIELAGDQSNESDIRGLLFKSGANLSQIMIFPNDFAVPRPLPDLEDLVSKMIFMHKNPNFGAKMAENAYSWVTTELSWSKKIVPKFHEIFLQAKKLKIDRMTK